MSVNTIVFWFLNNMYPHSYYYTIIIITVYLFVYQDHMFTVKAADKVRVEVLVNKCWIMAKLTLTLILTLTSIQMVLIVVKRNIQKILVYL